MRVLGWLTLLGLVVAASGACGGSQQSAAQPSPSPVSPSAIALQAADVPSSYQACFNGTAEQWLESIKSTDPTEYDNDKPDWDRAQQMGAIASWTTVYAAPDGGCAEIARNYSTGRMSAPYVGSFVFQFKDAKSAATLYNSGSFLGLDPVAMGSQGGVAGSKTGFGPNSAVISSSPVYLAYWQNQQYLVLVSAFYMTNAAPNMAKNVNGRIL